MEAQNFGVSRKDVKNSKLKVLDVPFYSKIPELTNYTYYPGRYINGDGDIIFISFERDWAATKKWITCSSCPADCHSGTYSFEVRRKHSGDYYNIICDESGNFFSGYDVQLTSPTQRGMFKFHITDSF